MSKFNVGDTVKFVSNPSAGFETFAGLTGTVTSLPGLWPDGVQGYGVELPGIGTVTAREPDLTAVGTFPWKWVLGAAGVITVGIMIFKGHKG